MGETLKFGDDPSVEGASTVVEGSDVWHRTHGQPMLPGVGSSQLEDTIFPALLLLGLATVVVLILGAMLQGLGNVYDRIPRRRRRLEQEREERIREYGEWKARHPEDRYRNIPPHLRDEYDRRFPPEPPSEP